MKSFTLLVITGCLVLSSAFSSSSNQILMPIQVDIKDKEAMQRGAALYMNFCSGCHSLKYMRYNRMAKNIGLTSFSGEIDTDLLINNLIFTDAKPHSPIEISMPKEDSRQWFGVVPPDLSLSAREKGAAWLYTYLNSFYVDESRPFGANNLLVKGVAMPNVLAPLIGRVIAPDPKSHDPNSLLVVEEGSMSQMQFESAMQDLVTFLVYVGEPARLERYTIGVGVLCFLLLFLLLAWKLKKAYWKQLKKIV